MSWASYQIRKLRVAHVPGMPGTFPPAIAGWRSRHASRHVRDARAVMHAGIANYWFPLKSVAGKTFPTFPAHAQPTLSRIWQEAHGLGESGPLFTKRTDVVSQDLVKTHSHEIQV